MELVPDSEESEETIDKEIKPEETEIVYTTNLNEENKEKSITDRDLFKNIKNDL